MSFLFYIYKIFHISFFNFLTADLLKGSLMPSIIIATIKPINAPPAAINNPVEEYKYSHPQ